jgi:ubiquinol-cytochrome c reductase cytochrome c subunit
VDGLLALQDLLVVPAAGRLAEGERLYQENCAACHSATGAGGALTSGQTAPSLAQATPVQVAEAIRVGPGAMPRFPPQALNDPQVDSITAYVGRLQEGGNRGGWDLWRIGPVTEGLVAWVVGLGLLILIVRRLGKDVP